VGLAWLILFGCAFVVGGVYAWSAGLAYILYDTVLLCFTGLKTVDLLDPGRLLETSAARPSIGVFIAAHDEAAVLAPTIANLIERADRPDAIIVADDGSNDGTAELLHTRFGLAIPSIGTWSSSDTLPLHWLRVTHGGKARALNSALETTPVAGRTEIVVTVDADTHLSDDAIAAMRDAFAHDRRLVAATGVLAPICGPSLPGRLFEWFQTYEYVRNFLSRYAWMRVGSLLLISGAFAAFRRDALLAVGGFDPHSLVEDYELIHRLVRHGALNGLEWHTSVVGRAHARTEAPSSISAFLRQRRRWFGGFLQTQYWYRAMVGDARYGNIGRWMLPVKAIDTMQPMFGLAALGVLVYAIALGRWSVLIPVSAWIIGKIVVDLAFHLWSVHLYRRWIGADTVARFDLALLAAIVEPFSFQILRHLGAALGWVSFLRRERAWGKQHRLAAIGPNDDDD
jgi:cellulose synthase/poly-beta-1,6-N-acetylglucosamine synthase-like glycosyltransferase